MGLRVLVSAPYMLPVIERFRSIFDELGIELVLAEVEERLSENELLGYAGSIDGVVCGDDRFTEKVLKAAATRLRVISKWGTGIDSIDTKVANELGIQVLNTPGAFTEPVADSVLGYMLAFARSQPWMTQQMREGEWEKIPGSALGECTLGVVGVGKIGKAVLNRAQAFGMDLLGNDIVEIDSGFIAEVGVQMMDLEDLLRQADFVSINCDLNLTSRGLIDREAFMLMQPHAVLINTARGSIVVEEALVEALRDKLIAGAALDVFEEEPLPGESPLLTMNNVLLAPHNANSSPDAWEMVHLNTLRNLITGLGLSIPTSLGKTESNRQKNSD
ncbi:MAG: phosphoglycerate dehydrogenase [Chloroflexota bacterium]|nr:phosphoglycerate dehydrogenase [Chloroflexota bacterium]